MSVMVVALATESGVPIFVRKRGNLDNVQFSTIASLNGVNTFTKCHNVNLMSAQLDNGTIVWKNYFKSLTLIGIVLEGLECDMPSLLSLVYDVMVFYIGKDEVESMRNVEKTKRDLRQSYPIIDCLLESLDENCLSGRIPSFSLDLIESILCPQAQQLQQALDTFAACVSGRWALLAARGRVAAAGGGAAALPARDRRLLALLAATRAGAPLRDTPVYLPVTSPNVAFRAVTCKLLADVYIVVVCGAVPPLADIDPLVLRCWEHYAQTIKEAKLNYPRCVPASIQFDACVLGLLLVNLSSSRCVFAPHLRSEAAAGGAAGGAGGAGGATGGSGEARRAGVLRTFFMRAAHELAADDGPCEVYWRGEYHSCHARRAAAALCCVLYAPDVPAHTMRLMTSEILNKFATSKDVYW